MKHFVLLILLSALSRFVAGQVRGQSDTASPASARQLKEIIIRGAKPPVQSSITGTVVNVQSSMLSRGSSVLDVLERSPGVALDHRNNSISLNGRSGVTVMIDGKLVHMPEEELLSLLSGMSADNVEKIELLTAPPSRYDASGSAGMINIVMKKNKQLGTTGSLSLYGGYGWWEKGGASANIDHHGGRTDWYGSYSYQHDHTYGGFLAAGSSFNPAIGGPAGFVFHDTNSWVSNNHNLLAGVDRRLGRGWVAGASVSYSNSTTNSVTHNRGIYTIPADSVLLFNGVIHGHSHWDNLVASLTVDKDFGKGGKLGLGVDWLDYSNNRPSTVLGNFVDGHGELVGITNDSLFASANKGYSVTKIGVGVIRADYSRELSKRWRLEAGVKEDHTQSRSGSGIESLIDGNWVVSAASMNAIRMREDIAAGYASVHVGLGEFTTLDLGLRYEYSATRLDDAVTGAPIVRRRLGVLFPNLLLTRKAGEQGQWQLSFSRRITRPSYKDLSSFVSYNDPFSVFTGNPLLQPTITSNVKVGYSWKGYSAALLAGRDDAPIFRGALTTQPGSTLVYIRPENLSYQNNLGFELTLPFTIGNWWTMSYGFAGGWRQYEVGYTKIPIEKTWFGYSVNFQESFRLPARFSAELSGWYRGISYDVTNRDRGVGEVNLGVKKEWGKGSLQFTVTDLFRMMNFKTDIGAAGRDDFDTHAYISWDSESRRFPVLRLTYSRSFGVGPGTSAKAERAGEEKERIK
ncbi:MAG TPA: TonB-dependent receptor [Puia sp.]|jgi:iron complex outermembrane receptor protein|nr:TonB-dependent receptor [Puia sp.]